MSLEGQVVVLRYPRPDQTPGKLRPMLVVRKAPGRYDDWLTCMISSRLRQALPDFDEVLTESSDDYEDSGLVRPSVIRVSRLAVVDRSQFIGALGNISDSRLSRIRHRLADWLTQG